MAKYGKPESVDTEVKAWCQKVDEEIWDRSKDRFGTSHWFESDKRKLKKSELNKLLKLIISNKLPCILHSGPYGNLSMSVYDHSDVPGIKPDRLFSLGEKHTRLPERTAWDTRFEWFAKYTHSIENQQIVDFYKLPEIKQKGYYEY